jgi:hypothetical protein
MKFRIVFWDVLQYGSTFQKTILKFCKVIVHPHLCLSKLSSYQVSTQSRVCYMSIPFVVLGFNYANNYVR